VSSGQRTDIRVTLNEQEKDDEDNNVKSTDFYAKRQNEGKKAANPLVS
jgi:hypothetical protein